MVARDPVANVFVGARLEGTGVGARRGGGELWGYCDDGQLAAVCYAGANLVPAGANADAAAQFAQRALRRPRRCSSLVGPADAVDVMWEILGPEWGPAREVRTPQPLMAIDALASGVPVDPGVRLVRPDEIETLLPACIAMFTEEVGVSPVAVDGGALYRARVTELVTTGRAFARIEAGRVLFKAEVGSATRAACQVQGVWVQPELRGRGLGTAGTAAVVQLALSDVAPVVSLYVNEFNTPALAAYRRVGFRQVGVFTSVLF